MMEHQFHEQQEPKSQSPLYQAHAPNAANAQLCLEVRRYLPELLENDGTLRPDQMIALNMHLAVCTQCAQEFAQMKQVIVCLEELPVLDPPADFSDQVMRRLQILPPPRLSTLNPSSSIVLESSPRSHNSSQLQEQANGRYNLLLGAIFIGMLIFLLIMPLGRMIFGASLESAIEILHNFAMSIRSIPLLGWLVAQAVQALASALETLTVVWQEGGSNEFVGALFDIALVSVLVAWARYRHRTLWRGGM